MSGGLRHVESVCQRGSKVKRLSTLGKIQTYPRPLVNNGSGPFHYPERSFHLTKGLYSVVLWTPMLEYCSNQMNQCLDCLLQKEHVVESGRGTISKHIET